MNVVLLTTQTTHHAWFLRELLRFHQVGLVVRQTFSAAPPFDTSAGWEADRDRYEAETWFQGHTPDLARLASCLDAADINAPGVVEGVLGARPDAVLSFGVGLIRPPLIEACGDRLVNLHGGDPERYRGLDSHLWSILHGDFDALVTTLHRVAPSLDTGEIVAQDQIEPRPGMAIEELRLANTEACLRVTLAGLDQLSRFGRFLLRRQRARGRYYSYMPACLKMACKQRFEEPRPCP